MCIRDSFEAGLETEATVLAIEPEEDEAVNLTLEARIPGLRFEQDGDTTRWSRRRTCRATWSRRSSRSTSSATTPTC